MSWGNFGDLLYPEVISAASLMATAKNMEPLQGMIDLITDQKEVKRDIRNEAKSLFRELAGERQFRLHLLARLQKAEGQGSQS